MQTLWQKFGQKVAAGVDVINLGQGNPDKPTPDYIVQATQKWVADPQTHKYSPFQGLPEFKQAAADFYQEKYGAHFDPEQEVAILGGSKIGLVELPWALMNPGDNYLLPDPGYPDYFSGAALGGVKFETVPLLAENNFLPDLQSIPEEVARRAKFFYLNYPNNPTGAVATKEFYQELVAWAQKYHVGIISDFAYGALGFDGQAPLSFMQTPGAKEVGIEFYTYSKTFNMAGWRIAFAVGNRDIISALNLIQDHLFVSLFQHCKKRQLMRCGIPGGTRPLRKSFTAMRSGATPSLTPRKKSAGTPLFRLGPFMPGCPCRTVTAVNPLPTCCWIRPAWRSHPEMVLANMARAMCGLAF